MPKLQMSVPGDVRSSQHSDAAHKIENDAEIAAIEAIDQYAAHKRHEQTRRHGHNDLPANLHGRMCGGEDVPTDAGEVHAAAEQGNEHREKEIAEAALGPNQRPVGAHCSGVCGGGGHGSKRSILLVNRSAREAVLGLRTRVSRFEVRLW